MNVLSLFDGISVGQYVLNKTNHTIQNYYASEIDSYAQSITKFNFPNTKFLGDVTKVKGSNLPNIDLLIGGSPCQGFSFIGRQLNFEDDRSKLFFEFVRLLEETNPKYFFLENVVMSQDSIKVITDSLGVEPIRLNSADFSAQNRPRLYWTNIPCNEITEVNIEVVRDILDEDAVFSNEYPNFLDLCWGDEPRKNRLRYDYQKARTLTATMWKGQISTFVRNDKEEVHKLTPTECERLQGLPTNYTQRGIVDDKVVKISNTQRYKTLGNSWNAPTVEEFFKNIKI